MYYLIIPVLVTVITYVYFNIKIPKHICVNQKKIDLKHYHVKLLSHGYLYSLEINDPMNYHENIARCVTNLKNDNEVLINLGSLTALLCEEPSYDFSNIISLKEQIIMDASLHNLLSNVTVFLQIFIVKITTSVIIHNKSKIYLMIEKCRETMIYHAKQNQINGIFTGHGLISSHDIDILKYYVCYLLGCVGCLHEKDYWLNKFRIAQINFHNISIDKFKKYYHEKMQMIIDEIDSVVKSQLE